MAELSAARAGEAVARMLPGRGQTRTMANGTTVASGTTVSAHG